VSLNPLANTRTNPSERKATQAEERRKNFLNKGHLVWCIAHKPLGEINKNKFV
jgi:hypothetical protein